jgi:hypothetical protein
MAFAGLDVGQPGTGVRIGSAESDAIVSGTEFASAFFIVSPRRL